MYKVKHWSAKIKIDRDHYKILKKCTFHQLIAYRNYMRKKYNIPFISILFPHFYIEHNNAIIDYELVKVIVPMIIHKCYKCTYQN